MQRLRVFELLVFAVILSTMSTGANGNLCKGCIALDSLTFDKMTNHFRVSLVKIDVPYPYGDKESEFEKIAIDGAEVDNFLVAEVGVKDYGEKDNEDIAVRFAATKEDFPVLVLLVRDESTKKIREFKYSDDDPFKADALKKWIRKNSGVYLPLPGCMEEFDKLADRMMEAGSLENRKSILSEAESLLSDFRSDEKDKFRKAEIYVKIMKKVIADGEAFVDREMARVTKVLAGNLKSDKKIEMEHRLNVLKTFDGDMKNKEDDEYNEPKSEQEL